MIPKIFPALVLLLLFNSNFWAAPGDLDATFGSGGKSLFPVSKVSFDQGRAAALQPDGKIVVVGDSISDFAPETSNLVATRLNANGSRDTSFGINGLTVLRLRISTTGAAVLIQPDGKIVIGGFGLVDSTPNPVRTFVLVRLLPSGAIDSTFGTGGVVRDVITTNLSAMLAGLAFQPDGKVVACGWTGSSSNPVGLVVARYNSNGSLDTSFDTDGKLVVNVNPQGNRGNAVLIQPDGKIVVGGSLRETTGTITDFLLVRLNTDGSFDNSFDSDGKLTTKITTSTSSVAALVLQGDGKIVAVGSSNIGANRNAALVRYTSGGAPDTTFDSDGIVVTDVTDEIPTSAALQSDGKILVGGLATLSAGMPFHFLASRYNSDGSPDNSFDLDGRVVTALTTVTDRVNSLLLQSDGRIVLAGSLTDTADADIGLARYNTDGGQDSTFDADGVLTVDLENGGDRIYDTAVQSDGKIVAVGYAFAGLVIQPAIARYNADGSHDLSFGVGGTVLPPIPPEFESSYADKVAIQSDGKIVFAILSVTGRPFTAVRLNADGSLDASFGSGGVLQITIGTAVDVPAGLVVQPDGKILMAGFTQNVGMPYSPALIRVNPNGELDSSFGSGGKVVTTNPAISGQVFALELQADGKILIAGQDLNGSSFFTSRYNTNGSIDTTFGGTGAVYTPVSGFDSATMLAVQGDGKIVAAGAVDVTGVAVRYTAAGVLDTTFDGDGKLIVTGESGRTYWLSDLKIQTNGKLVFSGAERDPGNQFSTSPRRAALIRFNSDGTPDTTFGPNGRVISAIGTYNSEYFSLNILSNGKIIGGGSSSNGSNDDFTLVRYVGDSAVGPRAPFDFDGDGKTDIGIFRPSGGEWWMNRSGNGQTFALQFGSSTDRIAPADYTGDGKADIAFFRPSSGEWYVLRSEDFSFFALPFGANGDVPVPGDYDADGKADFAVFRPSSSTWFISQSSGAPTRIFQFGISGDVPVVADYDADGKADVGVFRQAAGGAEWWIERSTAGVLAMQFGANSDKAVQGDYTGDGKADIAIWRPSTGEWFIVRSEDFSFYGFPFGASGDVVAPGDYDGDGKFDATVFRPSSATWFISRTTAGTQIVQFGANGDRPLPNAFVP